MRTILFALSLALVAGGAAAQKPDAQKPGAPKPDAPVRKPRFEGTFTDGTKMVIDAADEATARRLLLAHVAKENLKRRAARAKPGGATGSALRDLALDRVIRVTDVLPGLQTG